MGLRLGAIDLGLVRAYELRVSRAQRLGFRLGFKVRSDRFRVRTGLWAQGFEGSELRVQAWV